MEIEERAKTLTKNLLNRAKVNESEITEDLRNIPEIIGAKLIGLENKFKSESSLFRKLIDFSAKDLSNSSIETKLEKYGRIINDVLRFTFLLPLDSFEKRFQETLGALRKSGYEIYERRIWNAWKNAGTERDTGYRGINITVKSSQKQLFELQFHTEESFRLKTETHFLYQEARQIETSEKRRDEIIKQVIKLAEKVEIPTEYKK